VTADAWGAAFQRFVDALNCPRDVAVLCAAVADDVRIERHAPGERGAAPVAEIFTGVAEVARWLARTPAVARFSLAAGAAPDAGEAGVWIIEYAMDAGDFHNGGIWCARLSGDGRIGFLSHHPFPLRAAEPTG
jgi:hypothetical protein